MLIKTYIKNLDSNSRLLIPSEAISDWNTKDYVTTIHPHTRCLTLHPLKHWESIENKLSKLSSTNPDDRKIQRLMLGYATEGEVDSRGRIRLSDPLKQHVKELETYAMLFLGDYARLISKTFWDNVKQNPESEEARNFVQDLFKIEKKDKPFQGIRELEAFFKLKSKDIEKCQAAKNYRNIELIIGEIIDAYHVGVVEVTQYSKDDGIDLIIYIATGNGYEILFVQIKAGQNKVDVKDLRELIGSISLNRGKAGMIISTSGFTRVAQGDSIRSKATSIQIDLIRLYELASYIKKRFSSM